jgi:CRISPR-associated protein Csb2
MLVFEIEYLTGVSVSASPYHREVVEWPPHPDRLFQALVAAWGRQEPTDDGERTALEWLEGIESKNMVISSPSGNARDTLTVFVPPNDLETKGRFKDKAPKALAPALRVIPEFRKNRQPRSFPSVTLPQRQEGLLHYGWSMSDSELIQLQTHKPALSRLASEVTYIGHSHSLVRIHVVETMPEVPNLSWMEGTSSSLRVPFSGRLKELRKAFVRTQETGLDIRPKPSLAAQIFTAVKANQPVTCFDNRNITLLADSGGYAPTLAAFPLVARRLRDALLQCMPEGQSIPALLSGHESDGTPTQSAHLAMIPFADVGWAYSSGRLLGLGLLWPREVTTEKRRAVLQGIAAFLQRDAGESGLLHFGRNGSWRIALTPDVHLASLRTDRYTRPARRWGTVLPMVLDRHPKNRPGSTLADIIIRSCLNIGIPERALDGLDVEFHKHSPIKSAPSVKEVCASLPQDSPYRGKALVHVAITFATPVAGPVILGAGRFRGLGLCLPLDGGPRDA